MKLYKLNKQDDVAYVSDAISGDNAEVGSAISRALSPEDYGISDHIDEDFFYASNLFIFSGLKFVMSTGTSGWVIRFSMLSFIDEGGRGVHRAIQEQTQHG